MKLLLVNSLYAPNVVGGAERSVQWLAETVVAKGFDVSVATLSPDGVRHEGIVNGVQIYYLPLENSYFPFNQDSPGYLKPFWHLRDSHNRAMAQKIAKIVDKEKPNVVHTNNLSGFSVAIWQEVKKRRLPLVHTLRDYYLLCPRSTMFRKARNCHSPCLDCKAFAIARKSYSSLVDSVVGNSAFILNKHTNRGYFHNAQQQIIFNGYSAKHLISPPDNQTSRLRLGYLGQLTPIKGIDYCLSFLKNHFSDDVEFFVAGKGTREYETYLRSLWHSPHVHFLGFTPPEEFFASIDVLLVPSLWHEPLPRTAFEAYAYGKPVIGSSRGGIPEIIDEGDTGFIFNPDEPNTLERIIEQFLHKPNLSRLMRDKCIEKAKTFQPKRTADAYIYTYQQLSENSRTVA